MSNVAIRVDNLGKEYRIGSQQASYRTIRETIVDGIQAPFQRAGKLLRGQASGAANLDETIWALKDVSFEIKRGDVVGVIGRNGAGKSTLLKILSRITEPTTGRVEIHGRVGSLLEVGTGFHPELTGRENIFLNGAILGMARNDIARQFDEIVAFAEVERFIDTPVKHYSSGMYLRLAFAVAAHLEPEILLVDEVLAVGDAAFQKKCLGKMSDVASEGRTVLFVSHNMAAIQRLCTNGVLLENGMIRYAGEIGPAIDIYLSEARSDVALTNVGDYPRQGELGAKVRITVCQIEDLESNARTSFSFGEPIVVRLTASITAPVNDISFLIGIDSILGDRVVTATSMETDQVFSGRSGDTYEGRLIIDDLLLKPGMYSMVVGLCSWNRGYDQVLDAIRFTIDQVPHDQSRSNVSQVIVGLIQMNEPHWQISRA